MSSFIRATKRPGTGAFEDAFWVDDMYGSHRYGIVFPDDEDNTGVAYKADDYEWETEEKRISDISWDNYPKVVRQAKKKS